MIYSVHIVSAFALSKGGPTQSIISFIDGANNLNCHSIVFSVDNVCVPDRPAVGPSVETYYGFLSCLLNIFKLYKLQGSSTDLVYVHCHGIWEPPLILIFLLIIKVGTVSLIHVRGMLEPWSLKQSKLKKVVTLELYMKYILRTATYLVASTDKESESICNVLANSVSSQILISPNAIKPMHSIPFTKVQKLGNII